MDTRKHIVMIVPRGEAVRNFLYSDTIKELHKKARITVLSVVDSPDYIKDFKKYADEIIPLKESKENSRLNTLRLLLHDAHFKWLKSYVANNYFDRQRKKARSKGQGLKYSIKEALWSTLANKPALEGLTKLENSLTWKWKPDSYFVDLFTRLKPDLVFNASHIHGAAGELPAKIARHMGIPLAGFVFSWDNLTSRSRILVPYDYYFTWTEDIKSELLRQYPYVKPERVFALGTPQFDYHFKQEYFLSREELAARIGFDPNRPFILYTTGIDSHFPEEHFHVENVIKNLQELNLPQRPQLVVRTYVKGTSKEMWAINDKNYPDVYFPKVEWDETLFTPAFSDLAIYSSLVKYCCLGINVASTVTLEEYIFGKTVINFGFDPPGSNIDPLMRYERHILFDHFAPVAASGGSKVAYNLNDVTKFLKEAFENPEKDKANQQKFLESMFHGTLDGKAGERIGKKLLEICES
jgi:hypothetical protein